MKKICLTMCFMFLLTAVGFASPLMDYSQGKGAIELDWRNCENTLTNSGGSSTFDSKYNLDASLTIGLGNNFAFQYRNFEPKSETMSGTIYGYPISGDFKVQANEFNVLYKLDKNLSAMAGLVQGKGTLEGSVVGFPASLSSDSKNYWQIGLVGNTEIAPKTKLYAVAAAGADITNFTVGVSYEVATNLELDVNYRSVEMKKVNWYGSSNELKSTGTALGITYKF